MTIERVIKMLKVEYERAKNINFVVKPLSWALYNVWKAVDEAEKERAKMKVDGKTGIYDGVIHIFNDNKAKVIYLAPKGTGEDEFITLDDCLELIGHTDQDGVCYVIFDSLLHGEIYQYNNYSDKSWNTYRRTQGYA